jgi:hypothetical protein
MLVALINIKKTPYQYMQMNTSLCNFLYSLPLDVAGVFVLFSQWFLTQDN